MHVMCVRVGWLSCQQDQSMSCWVDVCVCVCVERNNCHCVGVYSWLKLLLLLLWAQMNYNNKNALVGAMLVAGWDKSNGGQVKSRGRGVGRKVGLVVSCTHNTHCAPPLHQHTKIASRNCACVVIATPLPIPLPLQKNRCLAFP